MNHEQLTNLVRSAERLAKAKKEIAKAAKFAADAGWDKTESRFDEAARTVHALGYQITEAAKELEARLFLAAQEGRAPIGGGK